MSDPGENSATAAEPNSSLIAFRRRLQARMGRAYGWKFALIEASRSPGLQPITDSMIAHWMRDNSVPDWAMRQLELMAFRPRPKRGPQIEWTETEKRFLITAHVEGPKLTNNALADMCTEKFGRRINENAIRGQLTRIRRQRNIPQIDRYRGRAARAD